MYAFRKSQVVSIKLGIFFYRRKKTPTVFCCFSSERSNKLPAETLQYYLFTFSLGNWIFEISRKFSPTKSNGLFVSLIIVCFIWKKSAVFIQNALCFNCYSRPTHTFAGYVSFTRYEKENQKSDNSQFPIISMVVKTSSASCFFG